MLGLKYDVEENRLKIIKEDDVEQNRLKIIKEDE